MKTWTVPTVTETQTGMEVTGYMGSEEVTF
jgi:coenzyme PQQ precursor peptide PqqA